MAKVPWSKGRHHGSISESAHSLNFGLSNTVFEQYIYWTVVVEDVNDINISSKFKMKVTNIMVFSHYYYIILKELIFWD